MNRNTYILAGLTSGLLTAWFWRRRSTSRRTPSNQPRKRERGTVIFDNTPTAAPDAAI